MRVFAWTSRIVGTAKCVDQGQALIVTATPIEENLQHALCTNARWKE